MNLRVITKNHAADPEIRFLTKSILRPYSRAAAMPTTRELKNKVINWSRNEIAQSL